MQNIFDEEPKPENRSILFKDDEPYIRKRLKRSNSNRIFFGVCAGLAEYYNINPNIIRLIFALSALLGGLGVVAYTILFLFIPANDSINNAEVSSKAQLLNNKILLGITLIIIGFYFLIIPPNYFPFLFWIKIPSTLLFPFVFLLIGIWLQKNYRSISLSNSQRKFQRPLEGRLLLGASIGLAQYFGAHTIIVRFLFILFAFTTLGFGIILYLLIALLSQPKEVVIIDE